MNAAQATPHAELIAQIMDSRVPKTEREHAAGREIERLRSLMAEAQEETFPRAPCTGSGEHKHHLWEAVGDSQSNSMAYKDVRCSQCGCLGELRVETGVVCWPAM